MDVAVFGLLALGIVTGIVTGMWCTVGNVFEEVFYRDSVAPWFRGLFALDPQPELMATGVPLTFQVHVTAAWFLYALWPFSRLVHAWSIPRDGPEVARRGRAAERGASVGVRRPPRRVGAAREGPEPGDVVERPASRARIAAANRFPATPPYGNTLADDAARREKAAVDLYWLPLGAGGHVVRLNGRVYEAMTALIERRRARDLYHSALQVQVREGTYVIEQTPVPDLSGNERGVVAEGAVGSRSAGRFRIFRYEIRLWRDGHIPDVAEAVESPRRLTSDEGGARRVLDLVGRVPTPVWGRDELAAGEMWNSNSVIAWVIARSGIATPSIRPPAGGRAPGWDAGLVVARRHDEEAAR